MISWQIFSLFIILGKVSTKWFEYFFCYTARLPVKVVQLVSEKYPYLGWFIVNLLRIWAKCKVISRKTDDFGCGSVCRRWVSCCVSNCELISMYYQGRRKGGARVHVHSPFLGETPKDLPKNSLFKMPFIYCAPPIFSTLRRACLHTLYVCLDLAVSWDLPLWNRIAFPLEIARAWQTNFQ